MPVKNNGAPAPARNLRPNPAPPAPEDVITRDRVSVKDIVDDDAIEVFLTKQRRLPSGKKYRVFEMDHPVYGEITAFAFEKSWESCFDLDAEGEPVALSGDANVFQNTSGDYIISEKGTGAKLIK